MSSPVSRVNNIPLLGNDKNSDSTTKIITLENEFNHQKNDDIKLNSEKLEKKLEAINVEPTVLKPSSPPPMTLIKSVENASLSSSLSDNHSPREETLLKHASLPNVDLSPPFSSPDETAKNANTTFSQTISKLYILMKQLSLSRSILSTIFSNKIISSFKDMSNKMFIVQLAKIESFQKQLSDINETLGKEVCANDLQILVMKFLQKLDDLREFTQIYNKSLENILM